jgi:hypothetical protein
LGERSCRGWVWGELYKLHTQKKIKITPVQSIAWEDLVRTKLFIIACKKSMDKAFYLF